MTAQGVAGRAQAGQVPPRTMMLATPQCIRPQRDQRRSATDSRYSSGANRAISRGSEPKSQNLIVWDVVFGTRHLPKDQLPTENIGIEDLPRFPSGFWSNLLVPFRWARVQREAGPA